MWSGQEGDDNPFADPAVQAASKGSSSAPTAPLRALAPAPAQAPKAASPKPHGEPVWLKSASPTPPTGTGVTAKPAQGPPAAPSAPAQRQQSPPPPTGPVPQLVTYMRISNLGVCSFMCVAAILNVALGTGSFKIASWVLAFYVLAFSCLLCCFEFQLRQVAHHIANNFGFLYDAKSRAVFLIFVGILCFSLGITGKIAGALMIANAIFNVYVLWKHPEYQRYRPPTAEATAANYLARNPQMMQQAGSVLVDAARRNPQAAAGAGTTWV